MDDRSNPKNYRPISITSSLCRLMERIVLKRLQDSFEKSGLLVMSQSGFRARRSRRDNLVFILQKIRETFNRKCRAVAIFFDIESAFDKVWLNRLINKLVSTPCYLLKFIINFLGSRSFFVKVNNAVSDRNSMTCGVPQGACLTPTLFCIYINDGPQRS